MGKRGRRANYITIGTDEVRELLNGKEVGVSYSHSNQTYYTMIPQPNGRTKRIWLGKDKQLAIAKFYAIVAQVRGEQENLVLVPLKLWTEKPVGTTEIVDGRTKRIPVDISHYVPESHHIEWLKNELKDPKRLARKTGIEEFAQFGQLLRRDTIPVPDLLANYLSKKKQIGKHEEDNSRRWFDEFQQVIDCKTVDDISLVDIQRYEDYVHSLPLAPKSMIHRIAKIGTIFKYNRGRLSNPHVGIVHDWLCGLERPEEDKPYDPNEMSLDDFNKLFSAANLKWKAMLLLGLNCAMGPTPITQLQQKHINNFESTAIRRGKRGRVLMVATLWDRTKEALQNYLETRKDNSPFIFITRFGEPHESNGITNYFNETLRTKAGISADVKFNHLRDTFSTLAQDAGYTIEQINLVLGHVNPGMNDRYAKRQAKKLTGEMCFAVERAFFGA